MLFSQIIRIFFKKEVNPIKTIYFNFHYFPFRTALLLPVHVFKCTKLEVLSGKIVLDSKPWPGMIQLGRHYLGIKDPKYSRTIWQVSGTLVVKGYACFGRGSKVSIGSNAIFSIGDKFMITGMSELICQCGVSIGNNCLISWDVLIMDTDFHHILDAQNNVINHPKPVRIGNNVWIGCRTTILKGAEIADGCVVAANSVVSQSILSPNSVFSTRGGTDTKIIRSGITWKV